MTGSILKNRGELLSHGNAEGRRVVLDILEAGLRAGDPYPEVLRLIRVEGNRLIVGNEDQRNRPLPPLHSGYRPGAQVPPGPFEFDLNAVNNIYVVGGGKAAQRMAEAIEHILGDRITDGQVNAKKGDSVRLKRINVTLAGHPIPDADSVAGSQRIYEIEKRAKKGDIVFLTESGGGSALMALPAPGITLEDLQEINRVLYFQCGATMPDTNAVRNLCSIIRQRHSRHCGEATMIHVQTDETPPDLRVHTSRPYGRGNSYQNAIDVLHRYGCYERMPKSVIAFLERAEPEWDFLRPEEWYDQPRYYFRIMGPEFMLAGAKKRARELGLDAEILVSSLSDIEARPAGETLAYLAQEIEAYDRPFKAPCVLLCGGELLVTVGKEQGFGGRNQEFVLSTAQRIAGSKRIVIASADSDGSDGPTRHAGGIVDGQTMERIRAAGIDLEAEMRHHNTNAVLQQLDDAIDTGILPTNVRDLRVIYVGA